MTYHPQPARCPHCGEVYKRLINHQPHCLKNPNRVSGVRSKDYVKQEQVTQNE